MGRRQKRGSRLDFVPPQLSERARAPLGIILGSPNEVLHLTAVLEPEAVCYQMDLHPKERIEAELIEGSVVAAPDLWDLEGTFQTLIYLPPHRGERELKLDMIDQAQHILAPSGKLMVWSTYRNDDFFPSQLKKLYGKVSDFQFDDGVLFIATRGKDRPRRRHEMTFQARIHEGETCTFLSRPGTFSYGKFDNGSRALLETAHLNEGESVLDLGCGCGTNGIFAWQRVGESGYIAFVDGNLRAAQLAEHNAKENGLTNYEVVASSRIEGLSRNKFDVVLMNPPYFAQGTIARHFLNRAHSLLRKGGRCYLVTKQPQETGESMAEVFGEAEGELHRGYTILEAIKAS